MMLVIEDRIEALRLSQGLDPALVELTVVCVCVCVCVCVNGYDLYPHMAGKEIEASERK